MYYDRQGNEITIDDWVRLRERGESYYRVALTEIPETGIHVSTVWLGLDHAFGRGSPLIFETMAWVDKVDNHEWMDKQFRYSTEDEARDGHMEFVADIVGVNLAMSMPPI